MIAQCFHFVNTNFEFFSCFFESFPCTVRKTAIFFEFIENSFSTTEKHFFFYGFS